MPRPRKFVEKPIEIRWEQSSFQRGTTPEAPCPLPDGSFATVIGVTKTGTQPLTSAYRSHAGRRIVDACRRLQRGLPHDLILDRMQPLEYRLKPDRMDTHGDHGSPPPGGWLT